MKGVLAIRAPGVPVVDVTHGVPARDVRAGALVLRHAAPFFPRGAVHVAVIDPGVGGARRPIAIETGRALFVGPDNGVLTLAAPPDARRRVVELTNAHYLPRLRSQTFHGRDVFAPMAAALALGVELGALGPAVDDAVEHDLPSPRVERDGTIVGEIVYVDHFGNLVSNVTGESVASGEHFITIGDMAVGPLSTSYADVDSGRPLAVVNSWELIEIAVRDGSARAVLGLDRGAPIRARPA